MIFPIYSQVGNQLTSLKGMKSWVFQINPMDLDQLTEEEKDQYQLILNKELLGFGVKDIQRFYYLGGKSYLCTSNQNFTLTGMSLDKADDPLGILFPEGDFYSNISLFDDYLKVNGLYWRFVNINEFPESIDFKDLMKLGDYGIFFRKLDPSNSKKELQSKRRIHYSGLFDGIKNLISEKAYGEAEQLLDDVIKGEQCLFEVEAWFLLKAFDLGSLKNQTDALIKKLDLKGGKGLIETRSLGYFFNNFLFGVKSNFKRSIKIPSNYLATCLPLTKDFIHKKGIDFISMEGGVVKWDLFHREAINYNVLISGPSGQGKSVLANKIIWEESKKDTKIVILDLGGSFKKTVQYLLGTEFSGKFDPLQFKNVEYVKAFLLCFLGEEKITASCEGKLHSFLKDILVKGDNLSIGELVEGLKVDFPEIHYALIEVLPNFSTEQLKEENLIYLDLSNYPEKIKPGAIVFLIEYFKSLKGKKIFIFDECWNLLEKNASFISECFRTFRKQSASAIAISQGLEDFHSTTLGRVIFQNSAHKILFRQSLSKTGVLDLFEEEILKNLQSLKGKYSEFLILGEGIRKRARYYPTQLEYELFTSDRNDNFRLNQYLKKVDGIVDFKQALTNFINLKYNKGDV